MSLSVIRSLFETRLAIWAADHIPVLPLAFENVSFTQPNSGLYVQSFLLPASTTSDTLDDLHRHYRGVYQVTIYTPQNIGPAMAEGIALELDALFPLNESRTDPLTGLVLRLLTPMYAAPGFTDGESYVLPVSATYRADMFIVPQP